MAYKSLVERRSDSDHWWKGADGRWYPPARSADPESLSVLADEFSSSASQPGRALAIQVAAQGDSRPPFQPVRGRPAHAHPGHPLRLRRKPTQETQHSPRRVTWWTIGLVGVLAGSALTILHLGQEPTKPVLAVQDESRFVPVQSLPDPDTAETGNVKDGRPPSTDLAAAPAANEGDIGGSSPATKPPPCDGKSLLQGIGDHIDGVQVNVADHRCIAAYAVASFQLAEKPPSSEIYVAFHSIDREWLPIKFSRALDCDAFQSAEPDLPIELCEPFQSPSAE